MRRVFISSPVGRSLVFEISVLQGHLDGCWQRTITTIVLLWLHAAQSQLFNYRRVVSNRISISMYTTVQSVSHKFSMSTSRDAPATTPDQEC